ncbi:MAG: tyrosine-type recombinase/integrase [Lachnospiraceae bacterium]
MNRDNGWSLDHPLYKINYGINIHFYFGTFMQKYVAIYMMEQLKIDRTPHCCRHTCISMLAEAGVDQTIIKKIVGHSGAMTLTEKVYTHFDIKELVDAINKI